jgi:prolyl oligopeptidase PreP (S9A serine peptidase family)
MHCFLTFPALSAVHSAAAGTKYDPEWDSRLLSLLDRGWVLGIAHVRGGGELGYAWHAAGRLELKPTSFSDLTAAAATLFAHNLTSPGRLAVWGRSAGGLSAAGAINAAPHLFNAALLDVPFLDVLGDLVDAGLPLTVKEWDEWGAPLTNASQAAVIASYSPVHNVRRGVSYPHMLVTAGLMDKRVGYWEAAKWVAQLRAAHSASSGSSNSDDQAQLVPAEAAGASDSSDAAAAAATVLAGGVSSSSMYRRHASHQALLLVTDMSGGHFSAGGSGLDDAALKYAFLIATLPSCGSRAGLTGPDVPRAAQQQQHQHQPPQLRAMVSLVSDGSSGLQAVLSVLPGPLQRLLVGLAGVAVAAGLTTGEAGAAVQGRWG